MYVYLNSLHIEQLTSKKYLTKKALANEMQMSPGDLSVILKRGSCRESSARRIANALDVDVSEIIISEPSQRKWYNSYDFSVSSVYRILASRVINFSGLAVLCGVSRQRISQLLKKGSCTLPTLRILANALEVPVEHILMEVCDA